MEICVYYEKINEDSIRINRVYSTCPTIEIPECIDGYMVREIADYCFSSKEVDLSKTILSHEIPSNYHVCSVMMLKVLNLVEMLKK